MSEIKEQMLNIAVSLFLCPATEKELMQRDFLKNRALEMVQRFIMQLEKDAIYYRGETMHIKKNWAKKNLKGYGLDFRTEQEKYIDSLTPFARKVYGL